MSRIGYINTILLIIVFAFIGTGTYFISMRKVTTPTPRPTPGATLTPTPNTEPSPTPAPSTSQQAQSITLLSQNSYEAFIIGAPLKIRWNISGGILSDAYVMISLLGPNDLSTYAGRIALLSVNQISGEYTWPSSSITVNGKIYQVRGDGKYWIKISLYHGNPDNRGAVKIGEDISKAKFELSYGGPPQE